MSQAVFRLNAFVAGEKGGNPAGVVLNADLLSDKQMQRIATMVGLSETAFVSASENADFTVRFFTPTSEVDLCGHATIATFSLLAQKGIIEAGQYRQETKVGILNVKVSEDFSVTMQQPAPIFGDKFDEYDVAHLLGLSVESILATGLPIQAVSTGLTDIFVPVANSETLHAIQPDLDAIARFNSETQTFGFHVFALTPNESDISAECRNFAPSIGINEEAATGSASGALACYLTKYQGSSGKFLFEQGRALGSPSLISAKVIEVEKKIKDVQVGGRGSKVETIWVDLQASA